MEKTRINNKATGPVFNKGQKEQIRKVQQNGSEKDKDMKKKAKDGTDRGANGKYTPEIVEEICKYIADGLYQKDACAMAGIGVSTYHDWINAHPEFSEALKVAEAKAKSRLKAVILEAAEAGTWQAAAWMLERRWKEQYSIRNEVTGADGEGISIAPISWIKTADDKEDDE